LFFEGGDTPQKMPFAAPASTTAGASPASPFGTATTASPFGDMTSLNDNSEPGNLSPNLEADPVSHAPWWSKITTVQIVLFFTFTAMTLSMLATVMIVAKTGAIHFNDDSY
jgi:hypothetical protein